MSSLHRTLDGEVLIHHLDRDELTIDPALLARTGRSSRTLIKEGALRVVIMALAADGELPGHRTNGPVTIHVLEGHVRFRALGGEYALATGDVLAFAAGVEHSAYSDSGSVFLLTVVHLDPAAAD
jgi:quercetin dioxygenase-like cupin family protein